MNQNRQTFAIMGATGKIGQVLSERLLKKQNRVRAIGRNSSKLNSLKKKGAEIFSTAFNQTNALSEIFTGCDGIFTMIPPGYDADDHGHFQDEVSEAIIQAIIKSNVKKVVNLSSIGAQHVNGTGPVVGLRRHEERLNTLVGVDVLHLRPASFMQNLYVSIPTIVSQETIFFSIRNDLPIWMVAAEDIGKKAAELLENLSFQGKSILEFVGPRQLIPLAVTKILGEAIGRPDLKYIQLSYEEERKAMLTSGMKPSVANSMIEMHNGFNNGLFTMTQHLKPENQGTTTFEQFAKTFAAFLKTVPANY